MPGSGSIDPATVYRRAAEVGVARLGDDHAVFHVRDRVLLRLNAAAFSVWSELDGRADVSTVVDILADRYGVARGVMDRDVMTAIASFVDSGVATAADAPAVGSRQPEAPTGTRPHLTREWGSTVGPFRALDAVFVVCSDDSRLARLAAEVFGPLRDRSAEDGDHSYAIVANGDGFDVRADGVRIGEKLGPDMVLATVATRVNELAVASASRCVCLHAGAVEVFGSVVLLPAVSGSGKSTLVTALIEQGARYLSDELAAIDVDAAAVRPFPKALTLDERSLGLFDEVVPIVGAAGEWHVDPLEVGPIGDGGRVGLVVSPRWSPQSATDLRRLDRFEALRLLLDNSVAFEHVGVAGFEVLAGIAGEVPVYELAYSSLDEAGQVIRRLLMQE